MSKPSSTAKNFPQAAKGAAPSARRRFVIAQREPWRLPDDKIELPPPKPLPGLPPTINWITSLLPPVLMMVAVVITGVIASQTNPLAMLASIPMFLLGLGFPAANIINYAFQKKKYQKNLQIRESGYRQALKQEHARLVALAQEQRGILEQAYPARSGLISIALNDPLRRERLWLRRSQDQDFLSLRMGKGDGPASFTVEAPRISDQNDPLSALPFKVIEGFRRIADLPILIPLAKAGSLVVSGDIPSHAYGALRRLLLEILVHHSPQDVQLMLLADGDSAGERWEWLKWAPHTRAIEPDESLRRLAFHAESIDACLEWLLDEFQRRRAAGGAGGLVKYPAVVVVLDDAGSIRQLPSVAQMAAQGHEVGLYILFAGVQDSPRECRARLDVTEDRFRYIETWGGEKGSGTPLEGDMEPVSAGDCEQVARVLAGFEVMGAQSAVLLPESIRISEVLGVSLLDPDSLHKSWERELGPRDMLQFPVGVRVNRQEIEPMLVDLRPEDLGGKQAFHTVLIGTTGSGKSVFLQSLVLAAAYTYSPRHLNILLMDFKAGASELSKLRELPHVVGLVTDLGPELAQRALIAIKSEIERRKRIFEEAGKISDIWSYNKRFPGQPLPHLLLVLDEFAKGVELLPDMQNVLQLLATQGRALGMYLLLANQKVNSAVDALLANIGWRIVLRVAERDEMRIVDPSRPPTKRPGRGYVRVKEDVFEFQGSRSDQAVLSAASRHVDEFKIQSVGPDGKFETLYKQAAGAGEQEAGPESQQTELDAIIALMRQAAVRLDLEPAREIYLDPLETSFSLEQVLHDEPAVGRALQEGGWKSVREKGLVATVGYMDLPEECRQERLQVHFEQQDGHLRIIGMPGSGKSMTIATLLLSLAAAYTPEEAQFYILEFGSGSLRAFETLPHTGAVIRLPEQERLERLLNYLDAEVDRRTSQADDTAHPKQQAPALFVVVNNFAELRSTYPDQAERFSRFARDGRAADIHLIIAHNRGPELTRMISSNIARSIVLQLTSRDETLDVLGRHPLPLSAQAEGRGYWADGGVVECQVAQPILMPDPNATLLTDIRHIGRIMSEAWQGPRPDEIRTLPASIALGDLLAPTRQPKKATDGLYMPVGQSYDTLAVILANLADELQHWLVLGPRQSGKSNFLACAAQTVLASGQKDWLVAALALRRSPLTELARKQKRVRLAISVEEGVRMCEELSAFFDQGSGKQRLLFLIDDLGAAFEPGRETLAQALNALQLKSGSSTDFTLIASGLVDEIRLQQASPLVRALKQSRTGLGLSKDPGELDWLGYQIPLSYRKMEMPPGRGFWVSKGKATLVQSPCMGD